MDTMQTSLQDKKCKISVVNAAWAVLVLSFHLASVSPSLAAGSPGKPAPLPLFGVSAAGAFGVGYCVRVLRRRRK
jgi:hypothetical protein